MTPTLRRWRRELNALFAALESAPTAGGYGGRFAPGLAAIGDRAREVSDMMADERIRLGRAQRRLRKRKRKWPTVPENWICDDYTEARNAAVMEREEIETRLYHENIDYDKFG